ncbi:hypothetical protein [Actinopolyspora mortivallis]|nr:hypothetical protein [Actinopolyspora mortivallis]
MHQESPHYASQASAHVIAQALDSHDVTTHHHNMAGGATWMTYLIIHFV